jgi:hypothetical protein
VQQTKLFSGLGSVLFLDSRPGDTTVSATT